MLLKIFDEYKYLSSNVNYKKNKKSLLEGQLEWENFIPHAQVKLWLFRAIGKQLSHGLFQQASSVYN